MLIDWLIDWFAWTLTRPTNFNLLRQNIVFSYSERIPVSFSWLFHYFSGFFLLLYVLINFYKNYLIIIILFFFLFMKIIFIFSCSGMFRDVLECSGMFHVLGFIDARSYLRRAGFISSHLYKVAQEGLQTHSSYVTIKLPSWQKKKQQNAPSCCQ